MTKDKKILYGISIALCAALLAALLLCEWNGKIAAAILLTVFAVAICLLVRKRPSLSVNKKEVLLLSTIWGILFVVTVQIIGLVTASYKNPYFIKADTLLTTVLPLIAIIVASEIIRCVLLAQKSTAVNVLAFVACVMAEVLMLSGLAKITDFNHFMDLVGLTLFPAITGNLYYHYVSKHYGALPNIVFRLLCTLYVYFLPIYADLPDALLACIKLFLPLGMLALTSALFEKKKKNALQKHKKLSLISTILAILVVVSVTMLISCQFRFGAIVIATESMTGEINKGDMIIYEKYDDQPIKVGQVIVFSQDENRIVHRVVEIEQIGNETRYITKGDANPDIDKGYVTEKDIVGLTDMKVAYIGFPTLWLRELLNTAN